MTSQVGEVALCGDGRGWPRSLLVADIGEMEEAEPRSKGIVGNPRKKPRMRNRAAVSNRAKGSSLGFVF